MVASGMALLGLVMAQSAAPVPLIPSFFTAQALFDICERPNAGQCSMYITGTLDGWFLMEAAQEQESFCLPQTTNREAADTVVEYLRDNPEVRGKAASAAIYEAVTQTFPCAPPGPEPEPMIESE